LLIGVILQFIESNVIGLRAAHYRLRGPDGLAEVSLLPMIHIGSASYYTEVRQRLEKCDVILFEGVRSLPGLIITLAYRLAAHRKRLGLVTQGEALSLSLLRARLVHADANTEEFSVMWSRVPWYQRIILLIGAPLFGLALYLTATRESIGRRLSTEETESREESLGLANFQEIENTFLGARDRRLIESLKSALAENASCTRLGVVYGAAHMRTASRLLDEKYKFRVIESEWIEVFNYQGDA
jgi:hypothetical protein